MAGATEVMTGRRQALKSAPGFSAAAHSWLDICLTRTPMGSLCSKSGTVTGGHQVLGSAASSIPGQTQGTRPDPRAAAAEAAERRQREAQERGVKSTNPNSGQLAAKLQAQKSSLARAPEPSQPERLVWD
ncbi:hypothetical protein C8Q74DRAFT_1241236 [Fomes fomentarius]|nr:hypothetical protein C8Q74DRAFT_1241236 [Fomes fomentarius]